VVARDDHLVARADVLLLQPRPAFLVQEVERDRRGGLRGREEPYRDGDQPERDAGRGYAARWHVVIIGTPRRGRELPTSDYPKSDSPTARSGGRRAEARGPRPRA